MRFHSPHANFQVICSNTRLIRHPVTGDVIETQPGIWANFGKLGDTYEYKNPLTGEMSTGAAISGFDYDTDQEALENGWDADTKAMVERKLVGLCLRRPDQIQQIITDAPKAPLPWPTFEAADAEQAVALAQQLGLVVEALAYEQENRARPDVIDGLTAVLETEDTDEEPAEIPAGPKLDPEKLEKLTGSRTITV